MVEIDSSSVESDSSFREIINTEGQYIRNCVALALSTKLHEEASYLRTYSYDQIETDELREVFVNNPLHTIFDFEEDEDARKAKPVFRLFHDPNFFEDDDFLKFYHDNYFEIEDKLSEE